MKCYNTKKGIKMKKNNLNTYDDSKVLKKYIESRIDVNSPHNQSIKEKLLELIGNYENKSILDLGCGIGIFSKILSDKAKEVIGVDISSKCIEYAMKNNSSENIKYKVLDINEISKLDYKFDIVFSDMVFNYIENYDKLLFNINNLLNEKGILVFSQVHPISTASMGESSWVIDKGQLKFQLDNYSNVSKRYRSYFNGNFNFYHRRFEELINIAKSNNFEIVKLLEPYSSEKEFNRPSFLIIKLKKVGNR